MINLRKYKKPIAKKKAKPIYHNIQFQHITDSTLTYTLTSSPDNVKNEEYKVSWYDGNNIKHEMYYSETTVHNNFEENWWIKI